MGGKLPPKYPRWLDPVEPEQFPLPTHGQFVGFAVTTIRQRNEFRNSALYDFNDDIPPRLHELVTELGPGAVQRRASVTQFAQQIAVRLLHSLCESATLTRLNVQSPNSAVTDR